MRITWEPSEDATVVQGREQARREKWFWMDLKAKSPAGCPERRGMGWERRGTGGFWLQQLEVQQGPFDGVPRISKTRW